MNPFLSWLLLFGLGALSWAFACFVDWFDGPNGPAL